MPELPEVEIIRLFLENRLLDQTIISCQILNSKSFVGDPTIIIGQKIILFSRHGKQLSVHLNSGLILLFHLKMTGQLILAPSSPAKLPRLALGHPTKDMYSSDLPNKSTRIIFSFKNYTLFFNDQRKFGWVKLLSVSAHSDHHRHLGPDILAPSFTLANFRRQLRTTSRPIKITLLDQTKFSGIGNIYASDSLFLAKIHPSVPANTLSLSQTSKLYRAILNVINFSISQGGSTTKDKKYLLPDGSFGQNQFYFRVYQRAGEPCLVCRTPIVRFNLGGRSTFFCPKCQKNKNIPLPL